jgi:WD40 repeat protein
MGSRERLFMKAMTIILGLMSMGLTVQTLAAPRCEGLFESEDLQVIKQLAELRVNAENMGKESLRKTLMRDYNRKLQDAKQRNLDLSQLPKLVEQIRNEKRQNQNAEHKKIIETREREEKALGPWPSWQGHGEKQVYEIAMDPTGQQVATRGEDGYVNIRDIETGKILQQIYPPAGSSSFITMQFSPDGKTLLTTEHNHNELSVWDISSGQITHKIPIKMSFDKFVFLGLDQKIAGVRNEDLYIVDVVEGKTIEFFDNPTNLFHIPGNIHGLRATADGQTVLLNYSLMGRDAHLLNLKTRDLRTFAISEERYGSADLSADGTRLLSVKADGEINLWDVQTHRVITRFQVEVKDKKFVPQVMFSPDGKKFAILQDDEVNLWDVETGTKITTAFRNKGQERTEYISMSFSADSKTLFAGNRKGELSYWREGKTP